LDLLQNILIRILSRPFPLSDAHFVATDGKLAQIIILVVVTDSAVVEKKVGLILRAEQNFIFHL